MSKQTRRPRIGGRYNYVTSPTVVLPGSNGTISGTAIASWLDEDGQSIYGPADATIEPADDEEAC